MTSRSRARATPTVGAVAGGAAVLGEDVRSTQRSSGLSGLPIGSIASDYPGGRRLQPSPGRAGLWRRWNSSSVRTPSARRVPRRSSWPATSGAGMSSVLPARAGAVSPGAPRSRRSSARGGPGRDGRCPPRSPAASARAGRSPFRSSPSGPANGLSIPPAIRRSRRATRFPAPRGWSARMRPKQAAPRSISRSVASSVGRLAVPGRPVLVPGEQLVGDLAGPDVEADQISRHLRPTPTEAVHRHEDATSRGQLSCCGTCRSCRR